MVRAIENVFNVIILWLVIRINNDKYLFLCKCWHICILRYCMKEDPYIIDEGFEPGMNESRIRLVSSKISANKQEDENEVEGRDLIVTDNHDMNTESIGGRDVLVTRSGNVYNSIDHK